MTSAIDRLIETAAEHHARLTERLPDSAIFAVGAPSPSGGPSPEYLIRVSSTGNWVRAQELVPARLPPFCAERHINTDGTFCLFWAEEEPLEILDGEDAAAWWSKLLVFLRRQVSAQTLRRWPGQEDARAHGEPAARHQANAERLAALMGQRFATAHREARFGVYWKAPHGHERLRLTRDGRRLATVIDDPPRIMTLRQVCRCDGAPQMGLPLRSCGNHADVLAAFALSLERQARQEKRFFAEIRAMNLQCCGTIDACPLAA